MKLVSFNVNGIRAIAKKGLAEMLREMDADIFCFQETKATEAQTAEALIDVAGYQVFAHEAERAGYSGTAILTRVAPLHIARGIGKPEHDAEGRVLTATFSDFYLVNVYTPNSGNELVRLDYRAVWDAAFKDYVAHLQETKPVIICGDLNVAHQRIDIARPDANYNKTAGFTQTEIDGIDQLLTSGFEDSFRYLHPEEVKYSWWSYRGGARQKNIGWRIDYFLVDRRLMPRLQGAFILNDVPGSDHCPVGINLC
jgi:exodeoxyribonuclease III